MNSPSHPIHPGSTASIAGLAASRGPARARLSIILCTTLIVAGSIAHTTSSAASPAVFIENQGQLDGVVHHFAPGHGADIYLLLDAVVIDLRQDDESRPHDPSPGSARHEFERLADQGCAIYIRFAGANVAPDIEARRRSDARFNFLLGNDPDRWRTGVPAHEEIVYRDLWPGIDLVYRLEDGILSYEIVSAPGSDPAVVDFVYEGPDRVTRADDAAYRLETNAGTLLDRRPAPGQLRGEFVVFDENRGNGGGTDFVPDDPNRLMWSTFLGGSNEDPARGIAKDYQGNLVVAGSSSFDFPTLPGGYDPTWNGDLDAFVSKLSAGGNALQWSTYIGGSGQDLVFDMTLDGQGNPVVAGHTSSWDFPGQSSSGTNGGDGFVAKLGSSGTSLVWSVLLGGNHVDTIHGVATDTNNDVFVCGRTWSNDLPTSYGAYDRGTVTAPLGTNEGFVAKYSAAAGGKIWCTYLGGTQEDACFDIVVDSASQPIVTGSTRSWTYPTTPGVFDPTWNAQEIIVTKLNTSGTNLVWSTFLGDAGEAWLEEGYGMALDDSSHVVVVGRTDGLTFPTTSGAFDTTWNGGLTDAFVSKIRFDGSMLIWSTYLGGSDNEELYAVDLDPYGLPKVVGQSFSSNYPMTTDAYDSSYNGAGDAVVTMLTTGGGLLSFSTYLGGAGEDEATAITADNVGNPVVTGSTESSTYPTTGGAYDTTYNGLGDAFVTKLHGAPSVAHAAIAWFPQYMSWQWATIPDAICGQLTLANSGGSDLAWDISEAQPAYVRLADGTELPVEVTLIGESPARRDATGPTRASSAERPQHLELPKEATDPRVGHDGYRGAGGPDEFGYRWIDSDEPGGPEFEWYDIISTGTIVTLGDDESILVELPFPFPFYGWVHEGVSISSNGYLTFGEAGAEWMNQPIPDDSQPNDLIAGFWDDLDPSLGGIIQYEHIPERNWFIVQYTDVPHHQGLGAYTFQMILTRNGTLIFQYLTMEGEVAQATVGIENPTGSDGLEIVFNAAYIHDQMAVRIEDALPWMTATPPGGALAPDEWQTIECCADGHGLEPGEYPGNLVILSNDPAQPEVNVPLLLQVREPVPDIEISPPDLFFEVPQGQIACDVVTIDNFGGVGAEWWLSEIEVDSGLRPSGASLRDGGLSADLRVEDAQGNVFDLPVDLRELAPDDATDAAKGDGDSRSGTATTDGLGGPDAFGYRWVDSDEPGGPVFDWIDITGVGTPVVLDDDDFVEVELPVPISFYGDMCWFVKISSNGYLTFGSDGTAWYNQQIPDPTDPNHVIAPFWDDLNPPAGGTVHYFRDVENRRFIVQYTDIPNLAGTGVYTFEVILRYDGTILFQYQDMQGVLDSATVGIENASGSIGLELAFNASYVHDGLAVLFEDHYPWLAENPSRGLVEPGSSSALDICVLTDALEPGAYNGEFFIYSSDPAQPVTVILVLLVVTPTVGVEEANSPPHAFRLYPSRPNPFFHSTRIHYDLPATMTTSVRIYDVSGRLVRVLLDEASNTAGRHHAEWDGRDQAGRQAGSGVYFYRLDAGTLNETGRVVLIR